MIYLTIPQEGNRKVGGWMSPEDEIHVGMDIMKRCIFFFFQAFVMMGRVLLWLVFCIIINNRSSSTK